MSKKIDLTLTYEELSDILEILEEGLISKESKGEDISKVRRTYFSLVNLWGDNASVNEPKDFERIAKYLKNQEYRDVIKGIISFDKDINDENVLDYIYNRYVNYPTPKNGGLYIARYVSLLIRLSSTELRYL